MKFPGVRGVPQPLFDLASYGGLFVKNIQFQFQNKLTREVQIILSLDHILYIILEDIHVLGIKIIFEYNLNPLSNNIKLAYTKKWRKNQQKDI